MRPSDSKNGFSLLEVLVAVLILSFISATIWVSFNRSVDVQDQGRQVDERTHEVRTALDRIAREVSQAFVVVTPTNSNQRPKSVFHGQDYQDQDRLDFTSFSHLRMMEAAKESDQAEISYFVDTLDGVTMLIRREDPQPDDEPEAGGSREIFLEDIVGFNLRYFDARRNEWLDQWDSRAIDTQFRIPAEVEIRILYKNHRGNLVALQTRVLPYLMEGLGG